MRARCDVPLLAICLASEIHAPRERVAGLPDELQRGRPRVKSARRLAHGSGWRPTADRATDGGRVEAARTDPQHRLTSVRTRRGVDRHARTDGVIEAVRIEPPLLPGLQGTQNFTERRGHALFEGLSRRASREHDKHRHEAPSIIALRASVSGARASVRRMSGVRGKPAEHSYSQRARCWEQVTPVSSPAHTPRQSGCAYAASVATCTHERCARAMRMMPASAFCSSGTRGSTTNVEGS